ncbi:hypothetical protein FRC02_007086 [Tulasnella sp. 418]|nr:hypothetical protein FRC02_007086 [Tulasnella sp. 418]
MSFYSISSTHPEPRTSPSPRSSPTPMGFMHGPLKRTFAFYIPRENSVLLNGLTQPNSTTSHSRRTLKRCRGAPPPAIYMKIQEKERAERDGELENEPEEKIAQPAKKRKIKD